MTEQRSIERRFSRAASTYEQEAELQQRVAEELISRLPETITPGSILDLGCGTGMLTELLAERFPLATIEGLDVSEAMIVQARQLLGSSRRFSWTVGDARELRSGNCYDLIASSSAIQWMEPLERTFQNLLAALLPGGIIAVSCMTSGTLKELHELRREVAPGKKPSRMLPSAERIKAVTKALGLSDYAHEVYQVQREYPDAQTLLRRLHGLGVTGGGISSSGVLLSRSELNVLCRLYEQRFNVRDGVRATYEICVTLGKKV